MLDHRLSSTKTDTPFDVYLLFQASLNSPTSLDGPLDAVFDQLDEAVGIDPLLIERLADDTDSETDGW